MKTIYTRILALIFAVLIAACGGGNGGNATSRNQSAFPGNALTITASSLPAADTGLAYSQALAASGGTAPYTWSIASGALPTGLTLSSAGVISGIPVSACSSTVTFRVIDSGAPQSEAHQALTITVSGNGGTLAIATGSLPAATVGASYNQTLAASGGQSPYTWSIASGALPANLTLSSAGVISGTPASVGSATVTFKVTDSSTPQGIAQLPLSITVTTSGGALTIVTSSLSAATVGVSYNQTMVASGGAPPYHWSLMSGSLPPGLSLSDAGIINGTPTTAGTYDKMDFMVMDASSPMVMKMLSITVN